MDNAALAERLDAFAALLDLAGSGHYTVRAYRRAADLIRSTPADVATLVRAGRVRELAGIGPGIEARLRELVETGELAELQELEAQALPELVGVARLLGLSAQRMRELGHALGIRTLAELREAAAAGKLDSVRGIGPKTAARIEAGLADLSTARPRRGMLLHRARALVGEIAAALGGAPAGDPRRACDLSTRFAVVVPSNSLLLGVEALPQIVAVLERDDRRVVGVTAEGYPIEVVAATASSFGTELVRATGSAEYVAGLGELPEASTEEELYARLGLPFRPPELRELDAGEAPSDLLELGDIRGELHAHTTASDGKASVEEMGRAAQALGYEYLAICDHTRNVRVVPGLDADDIRRQADDIAAANELLAPFRILRGSECDILPDGSLDLPDDVLAELEWVQISLHAGQRWGPRGAHRPGRRGDAASGREVPLAPEGADPQPPARERARPGASLRGLARDGRGTGGERPAGPARPRRGPRARRARGGREDRLLDGCSLGARAREHGALGRDGAAWRREAHATC